LGRKSIDKYWPSSERNLVNWVRPKLSYKRRLLQIIDPKLERSIQIEVLTRPAALHIGA
jgi:hypothetical protein